MYLKFIKICIKCLPKEDNGKNAKWRRADAY